MEDACEIETSDYEEMEALRSLQPEYWTRQLPTSGAVGSIVSGITYVTLSSRDRNTEESADKIVEPLLKSLQERARNIVQDSSRKRLKVSHTYITSGYQSLPSTPFRTRSGKLSSTGLHSVPGSPVSTGRRPLGGQAPARSHKTATGVILCRSPFAPSHEARQVVIDENISGNDSQVPSPMIPDFFSSGDVEMLDAEADGFQLSSMEEDIFPSRTLEYPPESLQSPTLSPQLSSPDPLALFTQTEAPNNVNVASSISSQVVTVLHSDISSASEPRSPSPLSPVSSSPQLAANVGVERQLTLSPPPSYPPHTAITDADGVSALMQAAEAAQGRYSLRARQARQKNPYAYDKALYKRQMRANPEAIVKVVSPRSKGHRRSKSTGEPHSGSERDTEYEYEFGLDEQDDNEEERRRRARRKGKSRSTSAGAEETQSAVQGSSLGTRGQPIQSSSHDSWYPSAFDEAFSSSSTDDDINLRLPQAGKGAEAGGTSRRKPQPFPFKRKDLPRPSSPNGQHTASPTDPRAAVVDLTTVNDSDEENEVHLRQWRRHSSFAVISLPSSPSSSHLASPRVRPIHLSLSSARSPRTRSSEPPPLSSTPIDFDAPLSLGGPPIHDIDTQQSGPEHEFLSRPSSPRQPKDVSDDDTGSEETNSSTEILTAKDRRRLKVLQRMMPRVLIQRHLHDSQQTRSRPNARYDSDSEHEAEPLRPGQTKVRIRGSSHRSKFDIRGDSESSDVEIQSQPHDPTSSSDSEMDITRPAIRPRKGRTVSAHVSNVRQQSDHDSEIDESDIGLWVSENTGHMRRSRLAGEAKEGDLIDRMLSRTRVTHKKTSRKRKRHRQARLKEGSSKKTLHIITSGAKKAGAGRQALLSFPRAQISAHVASDDGFAGHDNRDRTGAESPKQLISARKQKKQRNLGGLFTFSSGGAHLASGRAHDNPITIDAEAESEPSRLAWYHEPDRFRPRHMGHGHRAFSREERTLDECWSAQDHDAAISPRQATPVRHTGRRLDPRHVTIDSDIPLLAAGIAFDAETYLVLGRLDELIALSTKAADMVSPVQTMDFDVELRPTMSLSELYACLDKVCSLTRDLLVQKKDLPPERWQAWQTFLQSVNRHMSWLLGNVSEEDHDTMFATIKVQLATLSDIVEEPTEIIPDEDQPYLFIYEVRWFMLEALIRMECRCRGSHNHNDPDILLLHVKRFIRKLWDYGFQDLLQPFVDDDQDDGVNRLPLRIAELWVCLIHLVEAWVAMGPTGPFHQSGPISFWEMLLQTIGDAVVRRDSSFDLAANENIWRSIFALCSLSQFSTYGITTSTPRLKASWELVMAAMDGVRFTADVHSDERLPRRTLQKRDEYIRLLVARCLLLSHKWRWQLGNASALFNRLLEIFKSRRFANLSDEPSDFPSFLRHSNLQLLSEYRRSDTAFTLLLKLVVRAAHDNGSAAQEGTQRQKLSSNVKKLLSLCVPVGSIPFTKTTPPTLHELSMLYNRFSAVAVAIYLEPAAPNLKFRLANARRYVNFKDTDHETRRACIRGLMHLSILVRHLNLPMNDLLDWLANMTDILVEEYQEEKAANRPTTWVILSIQMLLGCVRRIIETPVMDPTQNIMQYPDPALLSGPWVTKVFASMNMTTAVTTRTEVRKLVEAFLRVRAAVVPKPSRPRPATKPAEESQESQDFGDDDDLNFDDPELLAALGEAGQLAIAQENKQKDIAVAEIIDKPIAAAIYRMVYTHLNEPGDQTALESYTQDTDAWVQCWAGCANVLVQNGRRDWAHYLSLGPQSWERIIDSSWRRRVGLRFMLTVLQLDPLAYNACQDRFMNVLFECFVTAKLTIEHDYVSLFFSVDRLQHPLLHSLPCEIPDGMANYNLSGREFLENRMSFIEKALSNLAGLLLRPSEGEAIVQQSQAGISSILTMFSTMQDIHQQLTGGSDEHSQYTSFCRDIYVHATRHPVLMTTSRLRPLLNWAAGLHLPHVS